jgi:signal transduction histidine kinase
MYCIQLNLIFLFFNKAIFPFIQPSSFRGLRIITLITLISCSKTYAQSTRTQDSLQQLLRVKHQSDEVKLKTYIQLGRSYIQNDFPKILLYTDSALSIANKSGNFISYLPEIFLLRGYSYRSQSMFEQAFSSLQQGLEIAIQQKDLIQQAKIYGELGVCAESTSELVTALKYNQQALEIYEFHKDTAGIVGVYNSIGIISRERKENDKARGNTQFNARLISNIGLILQDLGQYDSALFYFNQALSLIDCTKQRFGCALINNNIGICYRDTRQFSQALYHFQLAKKIQTELGDEYGLALVNINISRVYFLQGLYNESLTFLQTAWPHAEKSGNLELQHEVSQHTAGTYERLKNYPLAYFYQKKSEHYLDSMQKKNSDKELAELEVKYQVKQQRAENELLKAENELGRFTIQNKNLVMITTIIFSVLFLTLLLLAYRSLRIKQKTHTIIKEKNKKLGVLLDEVAIQKKSIETQKDEIAAQNEILSQKNHYLQDLNHEKNSLMGIVAHDLKSPLNSIGGIAQLLPMLGSLTKEQLEAVQLISKIVASSGELIRDLIDLSALENKEMKIHPELISIQSIVKSTQAAYQAQARNKGISLAIAEQVDDTVRTVSDGKHVERVLQNLVSNALKFSNPGTQVLLGTRLHESNIEFYVKDQGPGISQQDQKRLFKKFVKLNARPTAGESSSGLGLSITKALIEELGGSIKVESELQRGSTFICSLPIMETAEAPFVR